MFRFHDNILLRSKFNLRCNLGLSLENMAKYKIDPVSKRLNVFSDLTIILRSVPTKL